MLFPYWLIKYVRVSMCAQIMLVGTKDCFITILFHIYHSRTLNDLIIELLEAEYLQTT